MADALKAARVLLRAEQLVVPGSFSPSAARNGARRRPDARARNCASCHPPSFVQRIVTHVVGEHAPEARSSRRIRRACSAATGAGFGRMENFVFLSVR